ncbi:MAG: DNA/RNA non-specific endonuclease [Clostridia bacterium]|nr:DNA/RNA non-specific endonuclease [Clostridia bacterium]
MGGLFDKGTEDEKPSVISLDDIPAYTSSPSVAINGNQPFFTEKDMTEEAFETYSELDRLGRCGVAYANICKELMPTEDRGSISNVHPSGWVSARYDTSLVEGGYLYNRSHLIGFQLAGENANEKNLITGTRYFNVTGMLPFEDMVADYIKEEEDNHVLYRVTPIYDGDNLVASGVLMEAYSVEDDGEGVCYCVYVYNVQPGIEINYATGESKLAD